MPSVSVIMSAYREPTEYLQASVNSILSQTCSDFELIILLDDPENASAWDCLQGFAQKDPRVRLFKNGRNLGLTGSLNRALSFAQGEYVARMDADDISAPDRLEKQLAFLQENRLDVCGAWVMDMDERGKPISGKPTRTPQSDSGVKKFLRRNSAILHPTWFLKRSVYAQLGGYREIDACEDYDFLVRAALKGFRLGNVGESLLLYRLSNPESVSNRKRGRQKTALSFLSAAYRKGRSPSMEEWTQYMESESGLRKMSAFDRFYSVRQEMKKRRSLSYAATNLIPLLLTSGEAREALWTFVCSKLPPL